MTLGRDECPVCTQRYPVSALRGTVDDLNVLENGECHRPDRKVKEGVSQTLNQVAAHKVTVVPAYWIRMQDSQCLTGVADQLQYNVSS